MAGRFTNTVFKDTVESVVSTVKDAIRNPYYPHLDKSPTIVDYWAINKKASSLDEGALIEYSSYGLQSPIKYDFIEDFFLYGIGVTEVSLTNEEFGLQADTIAGEAFLLPNTIVPVAGDYFAIKYMKEKLIYRVTGINYDTLDTGANMYKLSYELVDDPKLELNIFNKYKFVIENVGTDFNCLIQADTFSNAVAIDAVIEQLKNVFMRLFYNERVQTFTYEYDMGKRVYDPFLIEFLIRTKILSNSDPYIYISHVLPIDDKEYLRYEYSIYKAIEEKDKDVYNTIYKTIGFLIRNRLSIFYARPEPYYYMVYEPSSAFGIDPDFVIVPFHEKFLKNMLDDELFTIDDEEFLPYNILIKYFNDEPLTDADLTLLKKFRFSDHYRYYYLLPAIIFCLNVYLDKMMGK